MNTSQTLCIIVALSGMLLGCASQSTTSASAEPRPQTTSAPTASTTPEVKASDSIIGKPKVLIVWGSTLPADIEYEVIGPVSVYKRWFGGMSQAYPLLADKAREMGGNAVLEAHAWLSPAFPAQVAPHGKGIVIRVKDPAKLEKLAAEDGQWE
jgi:hypothetical protein